LDVDAFLLADAAEVVNGKLYLMGGGWTSCTPRDGLNYPFEKVIASAITISVAYQETNEEHKFALEFRDADEKPLGPRIDGGFTVGRPPELVPGMSQLVQFAGAVPVTLPEAGTYTLVLTLDGQEVKRVHFQSLPKPSAVGGA